MPGDSLDPKSGLNAVTLQKHVQVDSMKAWLPVDAVALHARLLMCRSVRL